MSDVTRVLDQRPEARHADYPARRAGGFAGEILNVNPIADGLIFEIHARYEVITGDHSSTAVIHGNQNNQTGAYVLNGPITWGWLTGAQMHVEFDINHDLVKCEGHANCFIGEITIMAGSAD